MAKKKRSETPKETTIGEMSSVIAKPNTVLFAAIRLKASKTDAQYQTIVKSLAGGLGLTGKKASTVRIYQLAPIPRATLEQQKERPQILSLGNYDQAKSIAMTFSLYMTGKFDLEKNKDQTVSAILSPLKGEVEKTITQNYDKIGVFTVDLSADGGIEFSAKSGLVLSESHVETVREDGIPHPQLIYMAVAPSCKIASFESIPSTTKYGPILQKELELKQAAAEAYQKAIKEEEDKKEGIIEVPQKK